LRALFARAGARVRSFDLAKEARQMAKHDKWQNWHGASTAFDQALWDTCGFRSSVDISNY
jgi:hypothetical protein